MKTGRIVEVDYAGFVRARDLAKREGRLIRPADLDSWSKAVASRDLRERAFRMVAAERYETDQLVILNGESPWDGLYAYNSDTHTCIHFEVSETDR